MSALNQLLDLYSPPPAPGGLAQRTALAAAKQPQERPRATFWHRGNRRGGWRRGALIGSAALGLAFTSAVAAEVVSGGAIEIPVAHQVVEAIPVLKAHAHPAVAHHRELAVRKLKPSPAKPAELVQTQPQTAAPQTPFAQRHPQLVQRFEAMQQRVAERRAAGLPTPRADRLEAQANRIVQNRQAKGLPTPPVEQVEMRLALRQALTARLLQRLPDDPALIGDWQVQRFGQLLPPQRRERFIALDPAMQRQMMARIAERMRERRAERQLEAQGPAQTPPAPQSEGNPQPPR